MPETSSLPYRVFDSRRTVKQRSRRYDDESSLPTMQMPELLVEADDEHKPRNLPWYQLNWRSYTRSGNPAVVFWLTLMLSMFVFFIEDVGPTSLNVESSILKNGRDQNGGVKILFEMDFGKKVSRRKSFYKLSPLPKEARRSRSFGGLEFRPRSNFSDPITIGSTDYGDAEHRREEFLESIDDSDDEEYQPESNREDEDKQCREMSWAAFSFPTCNRMHEALIERYQDGGYEVSYLRYVRAQCSLLPQSKTVINSRWNELFIADRDRIVLPFGFNGNPLQIIL